MPDPTTRRAFFCQESLWQSFSDLAMKRGCNVDTLINEAMSSYLQSIPAPAPVAAPAAMPQQNSFSRQPAPAPIAHQIPSHNQRNQSVSPYGRQPASIPSAQSYHAANSIPAAQSYHAANSIPAAPLSAPQGPRVPPPAPNAYKRPPSIFDEPLSNPPAAGQPMVLASLSAPNPAPAPNMLAQTQNISQPPLYIITANQRYTVNKDKYIIGRSSQVADLVIRDGNISRKHCAIIFKNGAYYIKDLDSTNGIEFNGNRIDTKRIEEGDKFNICELEFRFTYR